MVVCRVGGHGAAAAGGAAPAQHPAARVVCGRNAAEDAWPAEVTALAAAIVRRKLAENFRVRFRSIVGSRLWESLGLSGRKPVGHYEQGVAAMRFVAVMK